MAADPAAADAAAKQLGLPLLDRLRALRAEFGLSLAAARKVVDATEGRPPLFPDVADVRQLEAALKAELGYCECASSSAVAVLRDLLRMTQARSDATGDLTAFAQASRALEDLLAAGGGWAEWLIYGLEQRGIVWHGFRQVDLWITEKGRLILRGIEGFGSECGCRAKRPAQSPEP
jgi:hypothetical protein